MTHEENNPTIVLTGGGTGGHITPILAVAHQLKLQRPEYKTVYIGEHGSKFGAMTDGHAAVDAAYRVFSGKYRRYYGESWLKRLFDIKTNFFNLRDVFLVVIGLVQAWFLLGKIKPRVVFLKGGFVGVPVGLAAAARKIPIVTHDSDILPGLANRLVGRWAVLHAVAMPAETYAYPAELTKQVGVLVEHNYLPVTAELQQSYRLQLQLPKTAQIVLITGGSSGAEAINLAMKSFVTNLLDSQTNLHIIHQTGQGRLADFTGVAHDRLHLLEFLKPMHVYMGAADVVVSRASANTLAELGVQGRATIVIPSPVLADGHQLKNAEYLIKTNAALVVDEASLPGGLETAILQLLTKPEQVAELSHNLQQLYSTDAAEKLASLLIEQAERLNK